MAFSPLKLSLPHPFCLPCWLRDSHLLNTTSASLQILAKALQGLLAARSRGSVVPKNGVKSTKEQAESSTLSYHSVCASSPSSLSAGCLSCGTRGQANDTHVLASFTHVINRGLSATAQSLASAPSWECMPCGELTYIGLERGSSAAAGVGGGAAGGSQ
jgi:hypothetical protein